MQAGCTTMWEGSSEAPEPKSSKTRTNFYTYIFIFSVVFSTFDNSYGVEVNGSPMECASN